MCCACDAAHDTDRSTRVLASSFACVSYHCQGFAVNFTEKAHIIRVTPRIDYAHSALVHHMLLFKCPTAFSQKDLDWAGNCYGLTTPRAVSACDQISVIAGWAVGGDEFVYPQDVGFPLGEEAGPMYMMLQIHYHNPNRLTFNDSAGFSLHLTKQLRQYDAGTFYIQQELSSINIPAKQSAFDIGVYCPDSCLNFPAAGVNVFASMLHTHETGVAVWTEHFRNGTQLPDIDFNPSYDFNFQQVTTFSPSSYSVLQKGDSLKLNCRYNTMSRTRNTVGGISTTDEMCMDYIWHYPALKLDACTGVTGLRGGNPGPGNFTASCNSGSARKNVINFAPPNVAVPLPEYPCTPAALGNRSFSGDGTVGTTAITAQQWLTDKATFTRSKMLDEQGDVMLYWNVTMDADGHNGVIRFAAEVATEGWFGVGISASGAMIDADSVIGWVHTVAEGAKQDTVDMTDRYNSRYGQPPIDVSQDIFDVVGVQDMMDAITPPVNPIYYNFTPGAVPCHHNCPQDEESSSSSSTGSVAGMSSSSSSSSSTGDVAVSSSSSAFWSSSSGVAKSPSSSSSSSSAFSSFSSSSSDVVQSSSSSSAAELYMPSSSSSSDAESSSSSSSGSDASDLSSSSSSSSSSYVDSSSTASSLGSSYSHGLSGGAIAGITIGSSVGLFLLCAVVYFVLFTGKSARSLTSSQEDVGLSGLSDGNNSSAVGRRRQRDAMRHGLLEGETATLI